MLKRWRSWWRKRQTDRMQDEAERLSRMARLLDAHGGDGSALRLKARVLRRRVRERMADGF